MLDWVTAVAGLNSIQVSAIDCITGLGPAAGAAYTAAVMAPVLPSGRLDQAALLSLPSVRAALAPGGLLLPHSLEVWAVAVASPALATASHLTSDQPVLGFKIADQVNILAVGHHQDLTYHGMQRQELTAPCRLATLDLTSLDLDRRVVTVPLAVTNSGRVNAIVYWFVQQFGWDLQLSTMVSHAFGQAAFLVAETGVEVGGELGVICHTERGLLQLGIA